MAISFRQVRRKADPEKERIREFIRQWSVQSNIRQSQSFQEITRNLCPPLPL